MKTTDHRRRLAVLHVIDSLEMGGSERQLAAFLLTSDATRFRHEVCTIFEAGPFAAELRDAGIPVHTLGIHTLGLKSSRDCVRSVLRLRRLVEEVKPDILHAVLYWSGVVGRVVGRLAGKPVVTSLVNTSYEREWRLDNPHLVSWKVGLAQAVDGLTARWWGTRFVAVNETVKASAVRQLGLSPDRISVIPRGLILDGHLEPRDANRAARTTLGLDGTYPIIVTVGRLVPQKGQRYAIQVMQRIRERFPTARLVIAGEGWLRPSLEQMIRSQELEAHVQLLGQRSDIDVLLRAADIFVLPSIYEGAANALLEAMSVGKPCVVTKIPSLCEITQDGTLALLADLRSPVSLATSILRLAEDRDFAERMGKAARDWVRARYDIRVSVTAHEALYSELVTIDGGLPERLREQG